MAAADPFDSMLQRVTEQVRHEHLREVNDLRERVYQLQLELERAHQLSPQPSRAPSATSEGLSRSFFSNSSPRQDEPLPREPKSPPACHGRNGRDRHKTLELSKRSLQSSEIVQELHSPTYSRFRALASVERLVQSAQFEAVFCALIVANVLVMALEAQRNGIGVGSSLGYHHRAGAHVPIGPQVFAVSGWVFGVLFAVEMALRIIGSRGVRFVFDPWNWIDLTIVVLWLLRLLEGAIPINPQLVRLARLARIARMLRLVKHIQGFESFFLLMTSLKASIFILGWTCCLLLVVLVFSALFLNQLLVEFYFESDSIPVSEQLEVYRHFGSFTTSLFSMFELTLAEFPMISRTLYENVSHWFILIAILYKVTIGFAVISVVNAVFIEETFRVAQQNDEVMLRRTQKGSRVLADKMRRLVATVDSSGRGELSLDEFRRIFRDPVLRTWLASMEFVPRDVDKLFHMMDDGNGTLSVDEVITGVEKFKGSARSIDLHVILSEQRHFQELVKTQIHRQLAAAGGAPDAQAHERQAPACTEAPVPAQGRPLFETL